MLLSLTLDDAAGVAVTIHAETGKRSAVSARGLVGIAPVRRSARKRPTGHGSIDESQWTDEQIVDIVGEVMSTVSIADALAEFRLVTTPMLQTLTAAALLKWTEGAAGLALQRLVKLASGVEPVLSEGAAIVNYQAQFASADPRAYSQTLTSAAGVALSSLGGGMVMPFVFPFTFTSSGGGTVTFTNAGNRPTPPVFRIYGMCVNPQIVNLTTGVRITILGTVASGDFLELNTLDRTVKLNGTTSRANFYDAATSTWFELPPGATNLQLVAGTFDGTARLDVLARAAYA